MNVPALDFLPSLNIQKPVQDEEPFQQNSTGLSLLKSNLPEDIQPQLFHTPDQQPYIEFTFQGQQQTFNLTDKKFQDFIRHLHWKQNGQLLNQDKLREWIEPLRLCAIHDGPEHQLHVRIASQGDNYYLDLGNEQRQIVEITPGGWEIIQHPPVKFRRPQGMQALPVPERGGNLDLLRPFINVTDEEWPLLVVVLISFLYHGPYCLLVLAGSRGSGKTTTSRLLSRLIDPGQGSLSSFPKTEENLFLLASHSHLLCFDNLSNLNPNQADALCRLTSGSAFIRRTLYSDGGLTYFEERRPVIINGIGNLVEREDLLSRSIVLTLPKQPGSKADTILEKEFEDQRPRILGACLDTFAAALAKLPEIQTENLPRLGDFFRLGLAVEQVLEWEPGTFEQAFTANQSQSTAHLLDHPLLEAIGSLMALAPNWEGTATDLSDILMAHCKGQSCTWNGNPQKLSTQLREKAASLEEMGVELTYSRTGKKRLIQLRLKDTTDS